MLKDNDEDFHMLFRNHLILPHLHNSYSVEYAKERACARLSAFQKKKGGIRPIACGGIFRRCFAALMAKAWSKEASKYFSDSVPNFMQCAGGMRDGTTKCAQLLRAFDSEPSDGDLQAILEMDIVNAFNAAGRQAAFDTLITIKAGSSAATSSRHSRASGISLASGGPCTMQARLCGTSVQMVRYTISKGLLGDSREILLRCCVSAPPFIQCGPG